MSASCPICSLSLPLAELERHANDHFDVDEGQQQIEIDRQVALQIASSSSTNHDDGVCCEEGYKCLSSDSLDIDEKVSSLIALQTKSSFYCLREGGLVSLLKHRLELESKSQHCVSLLSGYVDHFQCIPSEDEGWGCGWRNIQMLCSHLLSQREEARLVLFGGCGFVPDIPSLQRWLEIAWERGFDPPGALHFDHKIYGSSKWIGTTECASLLRSFGLRARIVDFAPKESQSMYLSVPGSVLAPKRKPYGPMDRYLILKEHKQHENLALVRSSSDNKPNSSPGKKDRERVLVDWVWSYFSDRSLATSGATSSRVTLTNKAPLYFQHDGHSQTIIGIQKHQQGLKDLYTLLILDPALRTAALERSLAENAGWQKHIKRGAHTLKMPEYQLCYVDHGIAVGEEAEQLKMINSVFVEL